MYRKYLGFLTAVLLFAVLNSCKKENKPKVQTNPTNQTNRGNPILNDSCNTFADCQAIGKYRVRVFYSVSSGPNMVYDTIYGSTNITIAEVSPGVLEFKDTSLLHQQFDASYDPSASLFGWSAFTSYNDQTFSDNKISNYGPDSIQVSITRHLSVAGSSYTYWMGARIY